MITNADVPLIRGLLCYLFTWPFYILRGLFNLHHVAVICTLFLVNLLLVMHGLISTYNYLISSCAYPGWAWHKFKIWMCKYTNRDVNPDFLCCCCVAGVLSLLCCLVYFGTNLPKLQRLASVPHYPSTMVTTRQQHPFTKMQVVSISLTISFSSTPSPCFGCLPTTKAF